MAEGKGIRDQLLLDVQSPPEHALGKVTVVGVGQVGMAIAFSIINKRLAGELCLVDMDEKKLKGELMDLQHGLHFVSHMTLQASVNYDITAGSKLCIICAGARQREGEDRRALLERNIAVFKGIIPQLVKYSPDTILLVVSNPVDVMSYVAWKISGFPHHRVFGSGTSLDSSRLRHYMSERLNIDVSSCHGFVIGEHGESSVVVWSGVNVGGVRLIDLNKDVGTDKDPERWLDIHKQIVDSATEVIKLKGYTSWAIGMCVGRLAEALLRNQRSIYPLSTMAKGFHGIEQEVYVSLPAVLAENGINAVVNITLTDHEKEHLHKSANELHELFKSANL
ncbi:L-lactate dehydrogenase-like [Paramacrobiotus metropolitanus]|uniref:L-lactate dehydrogenase-like n=1 Tax=Paramacrobiotus metropolitanus TaxID=2943436 RepID=UPI0024456D9A|nr:L-lactate dehydrogenase-like [Paramacrobiotus metropolitanus]